MRTKRLIPALMAGLAAFVMSDSVAAAPDIDNGVEVFKTCRACHKAEPGGDTTVGPNLFDIVGKPAGVIDGFRYSKAFQDLAAEGLVWTEEHLDGFLANPREFAPGTRMSFRGVEQASDRADLIAFLATLVPGSDTAALPAPIPPAMLGESAMEIEGDVAYGEYLASECLTCHQASGADEGIPSIVGWDRRAFIRALYMYKNNLRTHNVMQMVTMNLEEEEIAALAAYLETIDPE